MTDAPGNVTVHVLDVAGKAYITTVQTAVSGVNTFTLDVNGLSNGMYFVQIINGEKQVIDKFIVNK